ncbi:MAG: VOC family protein [Candidatus Dormibacteraeota bacterium]|nr:VOC family protein [Candidatus Dormibacteraeota bacterium]
MTDLDRAKRFYGETLGLTSLWENPASVRFRVAAGNNFGVSACTEHCRSHSCQLEVSDIEAVVRELEDREVSFIEYAEEPLQTTGNIAQLGPAWAAWFKEPDGNTLGLRKG